MSNKNIFIDTNIIIDFLAKRIPFSNNASLIFEYLKEKKIAGVVSITSFNNIYYILRKEHSHKNTIHYLKQIFQYVKVQDFNNSILFKSINSNFKDFEDAIQYFSAVENSTIDYIITRDKKGFKESKIPVYSPESFLKIIQN